MNDARWGRMFVRMCPYFPFSARVYLNQHHWLAIRMRDEGIDFHQATNAFLRCSNPARLQELADSLTARDPTDVRQNFSFGMSVTGFPGLPNHRRKRFDSEAVVLTSQGLRP
jgi:hypothetical protein